MQKNIKSKIEIPYEKGIFLWTPRWPRGKESLAGCRGPESARTAHSVLWACRAILACVIKIAAAPRPGPRRKKPPRMIKANGTEWESDSHVLEIIL